MSRLLCDFCTGSPASCAYLVAYFDIRFPAPTGNGVERFTNFEGAWGACRLCAGLIDQRKLPVLVDRVARIMTSRLNEGRSAAHLTALKYHLLHVYDALLSHLQTEALPLTDARVVALEAIEGEPMAAIGERQPDGSMLYEPIYSPGPHPLSPQKG